MEGEKEGRREKWRCKKLLSNTDEIRDIKDQRTDITVDTEK